MLPGWAGTDDTLGTLLLSGNVISDPLPEPYVIQYLDTDMKGIPKMLVTYRLFGQIDVSQRRGYKLLGLSMSHSRTHDLGFIDRIE